MEQAGCSGPSIGMCFFTWLRAQSARWCVVASVWSGHAQQRTLLWLGHPPLGLDMVCPTRLDDCMSCKGCRPRLSRVYLNPFG